MYLARSICPEPTARLCRCAGFPRPYPRSTPHIRLPAGLWRCLAGNDRATARPHPDRHHPALSTPDRLAAARWGECGGGDAEAQAAGGRSLMALPADRC